MSGVPRTMRAWQYLKCGKTAGATPLEMAEGVAVPVAGPGEVVVRVQAATINPGDYRVQSGMLRPWIPPSLPFTPGYDIAGEVVELGPKSAPYALGDQVFGHSHLKKAGGFAEYAVLPVEAMAVRPPGVRPAEIAGVVAAGLTALQGLRDFGLIQFPAKGESAGAGQDGKPRKGIMVAGASGGVGHYAVQLAKLAGLHVTATCGARNMELVKSLGADEVLDYQTPEGDSLASPTGRKYDVFFDTTSGKTWDKVSKVLAPDGAWLLVAAGMNFFGDFLWTAVTFSRRRVRAVLNNRNSKDLAILAEMYAQGHIKTHLGLETNFDNAPEVWKMVESGHATGKLAIVMSDKDNKSEK